MRAHQLCAALAVLLIAAAAAAQTPTPRPDVDLSASAGVYPITCVTPSDTDLLEICWLRVDLPGDPLELGCMPTTGPNAPHTIDLTVVRTPNVDAEIKCFVTDDDGNDGDLSANSGRADFTQPGAPWVVSNAFHSRTWPALPERLLELEVDEIARSRARDRRPPQLKQLVLAIED